METSTLLGDTSVINAVPPNQEMQDLGLEVNVGLVPLLEFCKNVKAQIVARRSDFMR